MKQQLLQYLLGTDQTLELMVSFIWGLIGIITYRMIKVYRRDPATEKSPVHFSLSYLLLKDKNLLKFFVCLWLTILSIRFSAEIIGDKTTMWLAFLYGACSHVLPKLFIGLLNNFKNKASTSTGINLGDDEPLGV